MMGLIAQDSQTALDEEMVLYWTGSDLIPHAIIVPSRGSKCFLCGELRDSWKNDRMEQVRYCAGGSVCSWCFAQFEVVNEECPW